MHRLLPFAIALSLAALLTGCATVSPQQRRISQNPEWYSRLKQSDQLLVSQGRIREGLDKNAVFLSWGQPDNVSSGTERGKSIETWTYTTYRPQFVSGFGFGYPGAYGYYGPGVWGYGPAVYQDVIYTEEPAAVVRFENDRVVAWQARR